MPRKPKNGTPIPGFPNQRIMGTSDAMLSILARARRVAPTVMSVLIEGPPGSGKEGLARFIHGHSKRKGDFVAVNCATLSHALAGSEMFGHVKGAFTGAVSSRIGLFEGAHSGTLFLDEVGEIELTVQGELLRALQELAIRRIGTIDEVETNFRVISATNADLDTMVMEGRFREDLLGRLRQYELKLPPLRRRHNDAIEICAWVLRNNEVCAQRGLILTPTAWRVVLLYPWPGNVRELVTVLQRAAVDSDRQRIDARQLLPLVGRFCSSRPIRGGNPEDEILSALAIFGDLPVVRLVEMTGLARDVVLEQLNTLIEDGRARRMGATHQTVYRTTDYEDVLYDWEAIRARDRRRPRRRKTTPGKEPPDKD